MSELVLRNRQRVRRVDLPLFRRIVRSLLADDLSLPAYELCIHLVGLVEMARVNKQYLNHSGSTDVITFDHAATLGLHGEIYICIDEAILHARRFRTTWQSEMVRYAVHGILHLQGHDDKGAGVRRKMKREENRLLRALAGRFPLSRLGRK